MDAPTAPEVALKLVMTGGGMTVKSEPLLANTPTVTTTLPVVAPAGTGTVMLVLLQVVTAAVMPLKVTVLPPWVAPKFVPVMVMGTPTPPEVWLRLVMPGPTVKGNPLLATPDTVTTILPVVAPDGTVTVMLTALQAVAVPADTPLKVTVLLPWLDPKLVPVMVMDPPIGPEPALRLASMAGITKLVTLLATPDTVTTTLPVVAPAGTVTTMLVALQLVTVAASPLKVIVLVPWVAPKFVPLIVMDVPTAPEFALRPETVGAVDAVPVPEPEVVQPTTKRSERRETIPRNLHATPKRNPERLDIAAILVLASLGLVAERGAERIQNQACSIEI
jgi:hypothetical protein